MAQPQLATGRDTAGLAGLAADARGLAERLPALRLEARRIAHTVAFGVHGRRRAGPGDSFWQFRQWETSDTRNLIDWRRSASSSRLYVRQTEWEAAHTVWLWADLSASMRFQSHLSQTTKADRAFVLLFALAELMVEGGERVGLIGLMPPSANRNTTERMVEALIADARQTGGTAHKLEGARLSRQSEVICLGDFLDPPEDFAALAGSIAAEGVRGHAVQVLDPAEESLDYAGRIEFRDPEGGGTWLAPRAEKLRGQYKDKLADHRARLDAGLKRMSWSRLTHHTDRPAGEALLALHARLSGEVL